MTSNRKTITDTVNITNDGLYRGASVHIPYPLESSDFIKLTKVNSILTIWAHAFFTGTILFIVTISSKFINNKFIQASTSDPISTTELITMVILILLAFFLVIVNFLLPSDKKKTISKIKSHFEKNEPLAAGFKDEQ